MLLKRCDDNRHLSNQIKNSPSIQKQILADYSKKVFCQASVNKVEGSSLQGYCLLKNIFSKNWEFEN